MGHKYDPDYAVHPGETVREYLQYSQVANDVYDIVSTLDAPGWWGPRCGENEYKTRGLPAGYTQSQMISELTGVVFCGEPLLPPHAEVLHKVLGVPAKFWIERQRIYDEQISWLATLERGERYCRLSERNLSPDPNPE